AWPSASSASPPIWAILRSRSASSSWYERTMCSSIALIPCRTTSAVTARDVIPGLPVPRVREDLGCISLLDQFAEVEERRPLPYSRRLLHRVRHHDDAVVLPQLVDELLDLRRRDRVERRARLVHQD